MLLQDVLLLHQLQYCVILDKKRLFWPCAQTDFLLLDLDVVNAPSNMQTTGFFLTYVKILSQAYY